MTLVLFLLVLGALVFVHELGHFLSAKYFDMKVEEFGLGFPPRAASYQPAGDETTYSLNWLPIGGFVRIFGEDAEEAAEAEDKERSFINKPKWQQVVVLTAGVAMNWLFAWLLFSLAFMVGVPSADAPAGIELEDQRVLITNVSPNSPAESAGLEPGDEITGVDLVAPAATSSATSTDEATEITLDDISRTIASSTGAVSVSVIRGGESLALNATPTSGIVDNQRAIGITMSEVGTLQLPFGHAIIQGAVATYNTTIRIAVGIYGLLADAVTGEGDLQEVAGPVGIAGLVGDAFQLGFANLLTFTALISINLALLNLIPFPALDGGRIVMVGIEKLKGSRIKPEVVQWVNLAGFVLLILLMLIVTYNDILRLI